MSDKKPDIVVWDKEKGYHAKSLPYGSDLGAPAFRPDTGIDLWKTSGVAKTDRYFKAQFDELQQRWETLRLEWEWNERVYGSEYRFEPVVGQIYHLYQSKTGEFLSLISPNEWSMVCIGSTRLNSDNRWERISISF